MDEYNVATAGLVSEEMQAHMGANLYPSLSKFGAGCPLAAIPSLSILTGFRVWGIPVEERREPIHGDLASAKRQGWRVLGQCRSNSQFEEQKICPCS